MRRLVVVLLVLGLGGAVVFLLSQLNARTYTLEFLDGKLLVMKGRMLPLGTEAYRPSDPVMADAYAPIDTHGHPPGRLLEQKFTEREELDRGLFELMEGLARPRVVSDDPKELEEGIYYLRRLEKLTGITDSQRKTRTSLESEVAYYQARLRLDDARRAIGEALVQLKVAADSASHNARSANQMMLVVEPAAQGLEEALRKAVHLLSQSPVEDAKAVPPVGVMPAPTPVPVVPNAGMDAGAPTP